MTGSKADSFGSDPWIQTLKAYLLKLYERGEKLLGVCFGHQVLALVLGGKTARADQGWGLGIHRYSLAAHAPWMDPEVSELTLLISHRDQVTELPEGATVIASSDFCPNAAYHIRDRCCASKGIRSSSMTTHAPCSTRARMCWAKRSTGERSPAWSKTTRAIWSASGCCGSSGTRTRPRKTRHKEPCGAALRPLTGFKAARRSARAANGYSQPERLKLAYSALHPTPITPRTPKYP